METYIHTYKQPNYNFILFTFLQEERYSPRQSFSKTWIRKNLKVINFHPKVLLKAISKKLREQSQRFKANKNCSEDDLVPFLGHGGTHKAVKPTASHGDYIHADHAPQFSILNYIDKLTLENMPDELKKKFKEKRRIEKLVEDDYAEQIKKHPNIITRGMKKASVTSKKAPFPADNSSPNQCLSKEEKAKSKALADALRSYRNKLYDEMATLSIPIELHQKMPTTLRPPDDIRKLTDENAETARKVMEKYIKDWTNLLKAGIADGY